MSKFKVGDKVVVLSNEKSNLVDEALNTTVTVSDREIRTSFTPSNAIVVRLVDGRYGYVYPEEVELEAIYNSPLYKALS